MGIRCPYPLGVGVGCWGLLWGWVPYCCFFGGGAGDSRGDAGGWEAGMRCESDAKETGVW